MATPLPQAAVDTPTPAPTVTFTPTPEPGTALVAGEQARITAPAGLNFRDQPSTTANLLGQLGTGQVVSVTEGPVAAENFIWWRLDDGEGNVGWAAEGDGETEWISPQIGEPQPANRAPRVGERVVVTMPGAGQLSVRTQPGTNAALVQRVNAGTQFTVQAGPQTANGFTWFQIRSDDGNLLGWVADGDGTARWLSPLE
ncbi:MAG: SH3 domain-containing protein [Litorilinea sp.]